MADVGTYVEMTGSNSPVVSEDGKVSGKIVHLKFTHASGNPVLSVALTPLTMKKLSGKWIYKIRSIPDGDTPVTEDSALILTDSDGLSFLDSKGVDFLSSGTVRETRFYNPFLGVQEYGFIASQEPITVSTSGNSVSGGIFYLKFYTTP